MATVRQKVGKSILGAAAAATATIGVAFIIDGVLMAKLVPIRVGGTLELVGTICAVGWVLANLLVANDLFDAGYTVGYERGAADQARKHVVRPMLVPAQMVDIKGETS